MNTIGIWGSMPSVLNLMLNTFEIDLHDLSDKENKYRDIKLKHLRCQRRAGRGWVVSGIETVEHLEQLIECGGLLIVPNTNILIPRGEYTRYSVIGTPWVTDNKNIISHVAHGDIPAFLKSIQADTLFRRRARKAKMATSEEVATWQDIEKDPLEIPGMDELDAEVRNGLPSHAPPEYD